MFKFKKVEFKNTCLNLKVKFKNTCLNLKDTYAVGKKQLAHLV